MLLTWYFLDYMDRRRIFTVDPDYFPLPRMREIVAHLHSNNQRFGTHWNSTNVP